MQPGSNAVQKCETCGNEYDKCFEVVRAGQRHVFDSFECAIHALAPECAHCHCRIIGHGVEAANNRMYCCAHCAQESGAAGLRDRVTVNAGMGG
ncbi:MAG: hypothetical protein HY269_05850 [Deltaproteobacteria bacterium]|nr:hypothetical protein [Deltaproteobacteria bacterium]